MRTIINGLAVLAIFGFGSAAFAQDSYVVNVERIQGTVSCQVVTGSDFSETCTTNIEGQASLPITMTKYSKVYAGGDQVGPDSSGQEYVLGLAADGNKNLEDVVLIQGVSTSAAFNGSMTVAPSKSPKAMSINPLQVTKTDATHMQVQLSFVEYKPADATHAAVDKQALQEEVMAKVRPILATAK
jgi:hypothetical protein